MRWKDEVFMLLLEKENQLHRGELGFFKVDKVKILIRLIDHHAIEGCEECFKYRETLERMIYQMNPAMRKREYKNLYRLVRRHLIEYHNYAQAGLSLFYGILSFGVLGVTFAWFMETDMILSSVLGICVGLVIGTFKEMQLKKLQRRI